MKSFAALFAHTVLITVLAGSAGSVITHKIDTKEMELKRTKLIVLSELSNCTHIYVQAPDEGMWDVFIRMGMPEKSTCLYIRSDQDVKVYEMFRQVEIESNNVRIIQQPKE